MVDAEEEQQAAEIVEEVQRLRADVDVLQKKSVEEQIVRPAQDPAESRQVSMEDVGATFRRELMEIGILRNSDLAALENKLEANILRILRTSDLAALENKLEGKVNESMRSLLAAVSKEISSQVESACENLRRGTWIEEQFVRLNDRITNGASNLKKRVESLYRSMHDIEARLSIVEDWVEAEEEATRAETAKEEGWEGREDEEEKEEEDRIGGGERKAGAERGFRM